MIRQGIDLPSNFTATVNAEMVVGALEETLTVSGQAPTVDTRGASTTQVISRDLVDAVPTAHDFRGLGATVPGVKPNIQNVGGTRALAPQILTVHGSDSRDTSSVVDGLIMNSMMGDDNIHLYHNDALVQEINYQTSAIPAEVLEGRSGDQHLARDGGNMFHGSWDPRTTPAPTGRRTTGRPARSEGPEPLTEPQRRALRHQSVVWRAAAQEQAVVHRLLTADVYVKEIVANSFYDDGSPGYSKSNTRNASMRLTWQATTNNKGLLPL